MITLDPEFVGTLAPPSKLTTAVDATINGDRKRPGGPRGDISFAQLPRIERLRVQGKADESENADASDDEDANGAGGGHTGQSRAEKEKKKMRGKGKSLKRFLRKQRKNVVDPRAVAIRAKLEKQREDKKRAREEATRTVDKPSALDRFSRTS